MNDNNVTEILRQRVDELKNDCDILEKNYNEEFRSNRRAAQILTGGLMVSSVSSILLHINTVTPHQKLLNVSLMLNVLSVAAIPYLYNFVSGDNGQNRLIANKFSEIKVQLEDSGANINVEKYEEFRDRFLKMREKYPFSANSRNRFRLF